MLVSNSGSLHSSLRPGYFLVVRAKILRVQPLSGVQKLEGSSWEAVTEELSLQRQDCTAACSGKVK